MDVDIDLSTLEIHENDKKRSHREISTGTSPDTNQESAETPVRPELRRSSRKKIRSLAPCDNRRVLKKPRKLTMESSMKDIENYYLDKKVKLHSPALETIFEEPKKNMFMSVKKLRRCINFSNLAQEKPEKSKVKKRILKAKKISAFTKIRKKIGMDFLLKKLALVEDTGAV